MKTTTTTSNNNNNNNNNTSAHHTSTPEITVTNLSLSFGNKCLFDDLDFNFHLGDKVTIVGENGCGKSTFLRLLSGEFDEENSTTTYSGTVITEGRIAFLPQHFEDLNADEPALIVLLKTIGDTEIDQFLDESYYHNHNNNNSNNSNNNNKNKKKKSSNFENDGDEPQQTTTTTTTTLFSPEWYQELNTYGGHEIFRQAKLIGLSHHLLEQPFGQLSGGEKTKVMLCALSMKESDIILLDEPTNHLDTQGIEWLESFLQEYDGGVIMATHDRSLINAVSNRISELSPHTKKFVHFRGGYDHYLEEEERRRQRLILEHEKQTKELKALKQKAIQLKSTIKDRKIRDSRDRDKLSYNNQEHRVLKGRTKAYNQLNRKQEYLQEQLVDVIPERTKISFKFEDGAASTLCVDVSGLTKSYDDELLFRDVSFTLISGDRLVVQGANGTGKSTLMKIMMKLAEADAGSVNISGSGAVVGYLDQEQEGLQLDKSPIEFLMDDPLVRATKKEAIYNLCSFGIYTWHDLTSPMRTLSIGCRRKVQLCQIIMRKSTVLLLDEPTNHIDFPSLEVIEEALLRFPGIIVAATHDRYFTEKLGTKVLNLSDHRAPTTTEQENE